MKRFLTGLCVVLALCLSACGSAASVKEQAVPESEAAPAVTAPAPAEQSVSSIPEDIQRQILENNRTLWEFTEAYESPWFYTFTDLDRNGLLEVISASIQGTGIFTYAKYYEVLPDGSGVRNCYHENVEIEGPDDWPEIVLNELPCYRDPATDRYYYACEGITRNGYAHQYFAWYALCLKDGIAEWEPIAYKNVDWDENGNDTIECRNVQNSIISEQDYDNAVEQRFSALEKSTLPLSWTQVEIPWEDTFAESEGDAFPS